MTTPKLKESRIRWNAGGWFGGAIGSSAWMLICSVLLFSHGQSGVAVIQLACFAVVNVAAVGLWLCRFHMEVLSALLILMAVLSVAIPVAWLSTTYLASDAVHESLHWPTSPVANVVVLLAAPFMATWFLYQKANHSGSQT